MSTVTKSRVSEAEFLSLPESVERIELIDGEVIVSPSPLFWHQEVLGRLKLHCDAIVLIIISTMSRKDD